MKNFIKNNIIQILIVLVVLSIITIIYKSDNINLFKTKIDTGENDLISSKKSNSTNSETSNSDVVSDTEHFLYETTIFDNSYVHNLNINISNKNWNDLQEHPTNEDFYKVDITYDDIKLNNVGVRTKGAFSLTVASETEGNTRYGLKLKFDKYNDDENLNGLKSLVLNPSFQDSTFMKEFIGYDMIRFMGSTASLTNYTWVTINNQPYGLFLGVEPVDEIYLKRNGLKHAELYKPYMIPDPENPDELIFAHACYVDDSILSYPTIFNFAKTNVTDIDKERFINSLYNIQNQQNLDKYLNLKNNIPIFIVNNFIYNGDSYAARKPKNFYLAEKNGMITFLPWDLNSALGANIEAVPKMIAFVKYIINFPIIGKFADKMDLDGKNPLFDACINDENIEYYLEQYDYLITNYIDSGLCNEKLNETYDLIKDYVYKDPTKYFDNEYFDKGFDVLVDFFKYRTQSVKYQLENFVSVEHSKRNLQAIEIPDDFNTIYTGWAHFGDKLNVE